MSRVASGVRSVRVSSGESRLWRSSAFPGCDLAMRPPSLESVVFIAQHTVDHSDATLPEPNTNRWWRIGIEAGNGSRAENPFLLRPTQSVAEKRRASRQFQQANGKRGAQDHEKVPDSGGARSKLLAKIS